jgi:phosphohistidine phosphatase SixA
MNADRPTAKDELITLAQAAERYGFQPDYLRQLALKGRLKAKKLGNFWVTTAADVEAYLASRQRRGRYKDIET